MIPTNHFKETADNGKTTSYSQLLTFNYKNFFKKGFDVNELLEKTFKYRTMLKFLYDERKRFETIHTLHTHFLHNEEVIHLVVNTVEVYLRFLDSLEELIFKNQCDNLLSIFTTFGVKIIENFYKMYFKIVEINLSDVYTSALAKNVVEYNDIFTFLVNYVDTKEEKVLIQKIRSILQEIETHHNLKQNFQPPDGLYPNKVLKVFDVLVGTSKEKLVLMEDIVIRTEPIKIIPLEWLWIELGVDSSFVNFITMHETFSCCSSNKEITNLFIYENIKKNIEAKLVSCKLKVNPINSTRSVRVWGIKNSSYIYYEGEAFKGKFNGKGIVNFNNQTIYQGEFLNGEKHGKGKLSFPNESYYEGFFEKDLRSGFGEYHYKKNHPSKRKYVGNWKENKRHGKGILYFLNGDSLEANWKNNTAFSPVVLTKETTQYVGTVPDSKKQVFGTQTVIKTKNEKEFQFYERYYGLFKNNIKNGKGCLLRLEPPYWTFNGDWLNGIFNGEGYIQIPSAIIRGYFTGNVHENNISLTSGSLAQLDEKIHPSKKSFSIFNGSADDRWSLFLNNYEFSKFDLSLEEKHLSVFQDKNNMIHHNALDKLTNFNLEGPVKFLLPLLESAEENTETHLYSKILDDFVLIYNSINRYSEFQNIPEVVKTVKKLSIDDYHLFCKSLSLHMHKHFLQFQVDLTDCLQAIECALFSRTTFYVRILSFCHLQTKEKNDKLFMICKKFCEFDLEKQFQILEIDPAIQKAIANEIIKKGKEYVPFAKSIEALEIMSQKAFSPRMKLNSIKFWCLATTEALNELLGSEPGADLLLPVLQFSLLRAGISGEGGNNAQLFFMEQFMDRSLSEMIIMEFRNELSYTWAQFNMLIEASLELAILEKN